MPTSIKLALDEPPLRETIQQVGRDNVISYLEIELIKLSKLISVSGNLNDAQVQFIAAQLIETYPNESLADFVLCFKRGAMGLYNKDPHNKLYRLDGTVIFGWMDAYLEEKYFALEERLKNEKDQMYSRPEVVQTEQDFHQEWLDSISSSGAGPQPVPSVSEEEIQDAKRPLPKKSTSFIFDESLAKKQLDAWLEKRFLFQEQEVRRKHPEFSEEQIQARCEELKWETYENLLAATSKFQNPKHKKIWSKRKKRPQ